MSRHRFSSFLFPCLFGLLLSVININQAKAAEFSISIGYGAPFVYYYDHGYHDHHHGIHSGYYRHHGGYEHRPDYHHGYYQHKRHDKHRYYDKRAFYGHHHDDRTYYKHRYDRH